MKRIGGLAGWLGIIFFLFFPGKAWSEVPKEITFSWTSPLASLSSPALNFRVILPVGREVWLGCREGLWRWREGQARPVSLGKSLGQDGVAAMAEFSGAVWLGGEGGLACFPRGGEKPEWLDFSEPVTALASAPDRLYVGTPSGVWELTGGRLNFLPKTKGFQVRGLLPVLQEALLINQGQSLQIYHRAIDQVSEVKVELNPTNCKVNCMAESGEWVWFGTDGGGLIGYNRVEQEWRAFPNLKQVDRFVSGMAPQGKYLWLTGFSGLYRYDTAAEEWASASGPSTGTNPNTALAVQGENIWLGTEGQGIWTGKTGLPAMEIWPEKEFYREGTAEANGRISPPQFLEADYASQTFPNEWKKSNLSVEQQGENFHVRLELAGLPGDVYRIRVKSRDGRNQALAAVYKQIQPLPLSFASPELHVGIARITGAWFDWRTERIQFEPGGEEAEIDRQKKTYSAVLTILPETRYLVLNAWRKGEQDPERYVQAVRVRPAGEVSVEADPQIFSPGLESVEVKITAGNFWEIAKTEIRILDPQGDPVAGHEWKGLPTEWWQWDGKDLQGRPVFGRNLLWVIARVTEESGYWVESRKVWLHPEVETYHQDSVKAIRIDETMLFDPGRATLKSKYLPVLDQVRDEAKKHPGCMIVVEGHTDNRPVDPRKGFSSNQALSEARAKNVKQFLETHYGIPAAQIGAMGYGENRPLVGNNTETGKKKNRRVEIMILDREKPDAKEQ